MRRLLVLAATIAVTGCATSSGVMDAGDGEYLISSHASAVRGGAAGATSLAYHEAQQFCASKAPGLHAVVLGDAERDVYQTSFGGSFDANGGGFGGGRFASGNAHMRFKCAPQT